VRWILATIVSGASVSAPARVGAHPFVYRLGRADSAPSRNAHLDGLRHMAHGKSLMDAPDISSATLELPLPLVCATESALVLPAISVLGALGLYGVYRVHFSGAGLDFVSGSAPSVYSWNWGCSRRTTTARSRPVDSRSTLTSSGSLRHAATHGEHDQSPRPPARPRVLVHVREDPVRESSPLPPSVRAQRRRERAARCPAARARPCVPPSISTRALSHVRRQVERGAQTVQYVRVCLTS
jgi:hypothetical protein